jgi:hypothetical protein
MPSCCEIWQLNNRRFYVYKIYTLSITFMSLAPFIAHPFWHYVLILKRFLSLETWLEVAFLSFSLQHYRCMKSGCLQIIPNGTPSMRICCMDVWNSLMMLSLVGILDISTLYIFFCIKYLFTKSAIWSFHMIQSTFRGKDFVFFEE